MDFKGHISSGRGAVYTAVVNPAEAVKNAPLKGLFPISENTVIETARRLYLVMPSKIRSFIAIKPPASIVEFAHGVQETLETGGVTARWVRPENMHLTLKFLGDIKTTEIGGINDAVSAAARHMKSMTLFLRGTGIFPGIKKARVIWAGMGGDIDGLSLLQRQIDSRLGEIGYAKEKKVFRAHFTLGRFKKRIKPEHLLSALKKTAGLRSETFLCDSIIHYQSVLKKDGPVYKPIKTIRINS